MSDHSALEHTLSGALHLARRPVAVIFRDTPPTGVLKFEGTMPAGCSFWTIAAGGRTFYTVPSDHYNCVIGSYTHAVDLPSDRAKELEHTLTFMTDVGYLRREEVPGIPRLARQPRAVVYAPLADTPGDPDVVIVATQPGRLMLLQEAALRAGVAVSAPLLARPTCMALPAAMRGGMVTSLGCIGNRIYTDLGDDELYTTVAGADLAAIVSELDTIVTANRTLSNYHRERRQSLATE